MCVGFWTLEHPDYALILCNNRDEVLARPTESAHFHAFDDEGDSVLSGRDAQAGGSWLGVNRAGRVALLTNITEPPCKFRSTRGHLVSSFLLAPSNVALKDEVAELTAMNESYAGFNLLLLSPVRSEAGNSHIAYDASLVSNSGAGGDIHARPLEPEERRCGGLSNGIDGHGAKEWPKVKVGTQSLQNLLDSDTASTKFEADLIADLFHLLTWTSEEPPEHRSHLRNTIHVIPFRSTDDALYGTRLSTVLLIRRDGRATFVERDIWKLNEVGEAVKADGSPDFERVFNFTVGSVD